MRIHLVLGLHGLVRGGLLLGEVLARRGKLRLGLFLLAFQVLVAFHHGIEPAHRSGCFFQLLLGTLRIVLGLLVFAGRLARLFGVVALIFLIHLAQKLRIIAGYLVLRQAGLLLEGLRQRRNAHRGDGVIGVILAHKEDIEKLAIHVLA